MTHGDFIIESREKRVFIGAEGQEYDTEKQAMASILHGKIADLFDAYVAHGNVAIDDVVDTILENRQTLTRWLNLIS